MKLIAAADRNWAIGKDGKLLVSIPEDMKYFRDTTKGNVVVMGRKTLESFPGGKPLDGRVNIVLTRNASYAPKGVIVVHSEEELDDALKEYDTDDVYVIGGESIYRMLYNKCDIAYITRIDFSYEADTHFPDLDKDDNWELVGESDENTYFNLAYTFCTYRNVSFDKG